MKRERTSGLRRALRRLTDPDLIGWQFFVLSLAAWLVSFYPQVFRGPQAFTAELALGWVLSILGGQIVLFTFLFLARTIWLRRTWTTRHPAVVVWTFIVGTFFGVLTANTIAQSTPASEQGLMFGVEHLIFGVLGLCIVGSIYVAFRTYRRDVAELESKKAELETLLIAGQRTLDHERASVDKTVTNVLTEALAAISRDDPNAIELLNSASDTLLRPLSHELAANKSTLTSVAVITPRPRWRTVVAEVTAKPLIAPMLTALILLLFAWRISFNEVVTTPPQAALDAAGNTIGVSIDLASFSRSMLELLAVFVGTYVAAWIVMKATTRPLRRSSPRARLIITGISALVIAVVSQLLIGLLFTVLNLQTMIDRNLLARSLILIPIAGVALIMGATRATDLAQRDVKEQLGEANRDLTWQVARINEEIWNQRRTLSLVVHGPVRAALIASAMELAKAQDATDRDLIETVTERISRARAGVVDASNDHDLLAALDQLRQLWAGTCSITISADTRTRERLEADPITAHVATKVTEEACANAIMHGSATAITVQLATDGNELDLTVTNDGTPPEAKSSSGLGTALLNDVSLRWSLDTDEDHVRLRAVLPLALTNL